MKLYLTQERHSMQPALCPSVASVAVRKLAPTQSLQWQESVSVASSVAVVPAPVVVAAAPAPAAFVTVGATESVRADLTASHAEAEVRIDATDISTIDSTTLLDQRGVRVQGTSGLSAKHGMTAPKPNGGVRGIPPRGRPV